MATPSSSTTTGCPSKYTVTFYRGTDNAVGTMAVRPSPRPGPGALEPVSATAAASWVGPRARHTAASPTPTSSSEPRHGLATTSCSTRAGGGRGLQRLLRARREVHQLWPPSTCPTTTIPASGIIVRRTSSLLQPDAGSRSTPTTSAGLLALQHPARGRYRRHRHHAGRAQIAVTGVMLFTGPPLAAPHRPLRSRAGFSTFPSAATRPTSSSCQLR